MTENPNLPAPSPPRFKLRPVIFYAVLPFVLLVGFGWYYGRPPALFLAGWACLGAGLGVFIYWIAKLKLIVPIGLVIVMMAKPFMHRYFLGISAAETPLSIDLAGIGAWGFGMMFCICILQAIRPRPVQP